MTDNTSSEQLEEAKTDDDEVHEDEVQFIDIPAQDQSKEEDKSKQPISVIGSEAQDDDMTKEKTRIKVVLSVHDKNSENPRVEIGLQVPE